MLMRLFVLLHWKDGKKRRMEKKTCGKSGKNNATGTTHALYSNIIAAWHYVMIRRWKPIEFRVVQFGSRGNMHSSESRRAPENVAKRHTYTYSIHAYTRYHTGRQAYSVRSIVNVCDVSLRGIAKTKAFDCHVKSINLGENKIQCDFQIDLRVWVPLNAPLCIPSLTCSHFRYIFAIHFHPLRGSANHRQWQRLRHTHKHMHTSAKVEGRRWATERNIYQSHREWKSFGVSAFAY